MQIFPLIWRAHLLCFVRLEQNPAVVVQSDGNSLQISDTLSHAAEMRDLAASPQAPVTVVLSAPPE